MKKQVIAYADLETTTIDISQYKDIKDYYKEVQNPVYPKIYSWCIAFPVKHKKIYDNKFLTSINVIYEKNKIYNFEYHTYFGISGESFIEFIANVNVDLKIYFNNSKSFDSHFILAELLKFGFQTVFDYKMPELIDDEKLKSQYDTLRENRIWYIHDLFKSNAEYRKLQPKQQMTVIKDNWNLVFDGEFRCTVNKNNQIYSMTIASTNTYWSNGKKLYRATQIWDSLLLFTTSIKKMGEDLAKYFFHRQEQENLSYQEFEKIFCKEELEYRKYELYKDFDEFKNDGNEKHYLLKDVLILAVFQEMMETHLPRAEWKLTAAATAYANFMKSYGEYYLPSLLKEKIVKKVNLQNGGHKYQYKNQKRLYSPAGIGKVLFSKLFPTKWMDTADREFETAHSHCYQWYGGGISHVNEKYRGRILRNLTIADVNSSYPSQMNSNKMCPYGEGVRGDKKGYDFKFYTMLIINDINNPKGLPFLFSITDEKREWKKTLKAGDVVKLTSPEYEKFLKYYTAKSNDYILKTEWSFKQMPLKDIFGMFVNKWYPLKQKASKENDTLLKAIIKLFLNSLYGKFGTKSILESKIFNSFENSWELVSERLKTKYYLPIAIAITMYARLLLVDGVGENYDNFVYCDTDSLFMLDFENLDFPNIEFDDTKLGAFAIEQEHLTGICRRSKQYYYIRMKGDEIDLFNGKPKKKVAFAGINFNRDWISDEDLDFVEEADKIIDTLSAKDFIVGKEINNQLQPYRIVGEGIILRETIKSIKAIWDYKPLQEQIYRTEADYISQLEIVKNLNI